MSNESTRDFDGLVAVVTGGASGIGAAIADQLAAAGAKVHVLDLSESADHPSHVCDVSNDVTVRAAIEATVDSEGRLDIVVNNAGIGAQGTVEDNSDDEWQRVLDINVIGMARVSRAALPHLRTSSNGVIVNTCSIAATAGLPQRALYSASKGAVLSLTQAMAADYIREGIRVNAVCPGTADTPWIGRLLDKADDPEAERAALEARQPHGRLVSADEVGYAVLTLASPRAGSTTGVALAVDGGMQALRLRPIGQ